MAKRKKLVDLYKRSTTVTIGDGEDTVEVAIVKLNDIDTDEVLRKANAARARILADRNNKTSELYLSVWSEVDEFATEDDPSFLVSHVTIQELAKRAESIEAELGGADDSEWAKDDYLQGLRDAWEGGLKERHVEDPEDPESKKVLAELTRFVDEVNVKVEEEREDLAAVYETMPFDVLREKVVKASLQSVAESAWWTEYRLHRAYLTTREPHDHSIRHFDNRLDVDATNSEVRSQLFAYYEAMAVDDREGKGSPGTPGSSATSASLDGAETSDSSGPVIVTQ